MKTGFVSLDRLLESIRADRPSFLKIPSRPGIPPHTNGWENDINIVATRRKISGGIQSDEGRAALDAMLSVMKPRKKLAISFWDYLGDRLGVRGRAVPPLAEFLTAP